MHTNFYSNNHFTSKLDINLKFVYYTNVTKPPYFSKFIKENDEYFGFIYSVSGSGIITINNIDYTLNENNFILSTNKEIDSIKSNNTWSFFFFWFDSNIKFFPLNKIIHQPLSTSDFSTMQYIIEIMLLKNEILQFKANAFFIEIFSRFVFNTKNTTIYKKEIEKVINFINRNLDKNITTKQLAELCSYSEKNFRRIFEKDVGITPKKYIIDCKLEQAKYMLQTTNYRIIDIAYEFCFSSPSHFSSAFKSKYNISPHSLK